MLNRLDKIQFNSYQKNRFSVFEYPKTSIYRCNIMFKSSENSPLNDEQQAFLDEAFSNIKRDNIEVEMGKRYLKIKNTYRNFMLIPYENSEGGRYYMSSNLPSGMSIQIKELTGEQYNYMLKNLQTEGKIKTNAVSRFLAGLTEKGTINKLNLLLDRQEFSSGIKKGVDKIYAKFVEEEMFAENLKRKGLTWDDFIKLDTQQGQAIESEWQEYLESETGKAELKREIETKPPKLDELTQAVRDKIWEEFLKDNGLSLDEFAELNKLSMYRINYARAQTLRFKFKDYIESPEGKTKLERMVEEAKHNEVRESDAREPENIIDKLVGIGATIKQRMRK